MCSLKDNNRRIRPASDGLILELKSAHPPSLEGRAGCETWSVDFSPDGSWFAWSMGHGIVWVIAWPLRHDKVNRVEIALESNRQDKTLNCGQTVWGLAFGPRPSKTPAPGEKAASRERESSRLLLATGLENGVIKIWDVETGQPRFDLKGHEGIARDLVFTPNEKLTLVSSSRDKTLRIWDLTQKGEKEPHVLSGHKDWVSCCSVSPDCSMIASVGRFDRMVCLWSLRSYTFIRNLTGINHKTFYLLASCDFSPDGALLATAAFSGSRWWIDLWDPYTAQKLSSLMDCSEMYGQNQISSLRFSPEGLQLAIVTEDSPPDVGARTEGYGDADQGGPYLQWAVLQLPSTRGSRSHRDQRWPCEVLDGSQVSAQSVPPVPLRPAPLSLHTPGGGPPHTTQDPGVPHLQRHPGPLRSTI
uniref:Uncharacterized protein n=1 Tax=Oncorhynchus tshawytscha TaxID=74940 RepID=A0A8C8HWJ6_ONCTS